MIITKDSKIGGILKKYPHLLDILVNYNPHFKLLKKSLLRNTIAKLATVEKAAKVAGVSLRGLLKELNHAVGYELSHTELAGIPELKRGPEFPPPEVTSVKTEDIVTLDAREMLHRGEEPFGKIMEAVRSLKQGQIFLLEAIFEPGPLYDLLEKKGFLSYTEKVADEHYKVYFYKKDSIKKTTGIAYEELAPEKRIRKEGENIFVDVKGLEPPQPMELILSVLSEMGKGKTLVIEHERKPVFLLPKLEERGYTYVIDEIKPGNVIIKIKKRT